MWVICMEYRDRINPRGSTRRIPIQLVRGQNGTVHTFFDTNIAVHCEKDAPSRVPIRQHHRFYESVVATIFESRGLLEATRNTESIVGRLTLGFLLLSLGLARSGGRIVTTVTWRRGQIVSPKLEPIRTARIELCWPLGVLPLAVRYQSLPAWPPRKSSMLVPATVSQTPIQDQHYHDAPFLSSI